MYVKEGFIHLSKMPLISKSTEMQTKVSYVFNNIRFAVLCASPKVSAKDKLEK